MTISDIHPDIMHRLVEMADTNEKSIDDLLKQLLDSAASNQPASQNGSARSLQMFRGIFDFNNDAIFIVDHEILTIRAANPSARKMFGYDLDDEFFGVSAFDMVEERERDEAISQINAAIADNAPDFYERTFVRKNGSTFMGEVHVTLIRDTAGNSLHLQLIIRDITARKTVEEGLHEALRRERELNDLRTRVILTVSHEFRTPLAIIQSSNELMMRHLERLDQEKRQKHLDRIHENIKHMTQMVDAILDVNQIQSQGIIAEGHKIDVITVFNAAIRQATRGHNKQIKITLNASHDSFNMQIDSAIVLMILRELLDNSMTYSKDGACITIDLRCSEEEIEFEVKDEGAGIPASEQKHIFDYFFRGSNVHTIPGTGLGLTIVRMAIEAHNGTINVTSTENEGSAFRVMLPAL